MHSAATFCLYSTIQLGMDKYLSYNLMGFFFPPFNWKKTRVCPSCVRTCRWLMLSSPKKFNLLYPYNSGLPRWQNGKESACQCKRCKRCGLDPWVGKIPCKWQPTPVFMLGKFHGQRNQVGYSPWDHKEWDMTKVTEHTHPYVHERRGFPCPPPEHLPDPGIKLGSLESPALAGKFFFFSLFVCLPLVPPGKFTHCL